MSDLRPVLYVEDEENDVLFMELAFKRSGIEWPLATASDGQQAIDYLCGCFRDQERCPIPSLVLLDLNLPLKSGFEVLSWIRSQPAFENMPVVIFTSSPQDSDMHVAIESGADGYLVKPTNPAKLAELVRQIEARWLSNSTRGNSTREP